jgi:hypothetical protein
VKYQDQLSSSPPSTVSKASGSHRIQPVLNGSTHLSDHLTGAIWAFGWGIAAASGGLLGGVLGLRTRLGHRAIAAFMSLGAGVLLSAASFKVATEALVIAGALLTTGGVIAGAGHVQRRERNSG